MRLAAKLTLALTCAILAVLAMISWVSVRREIALFDEDMRRDSHLLGRAVAGAAGRVWGRVGEAEAIDVVDDANQREAQVLIRWVWLDAPAGDVLAPSVAGAVGRRDAAVRFVTARPPGAADDVLFTFVPVEGPGPRRVAIELSESLASKHQYVRDTIVQATIATGTLVLLCSGLILGLGAVLVGRPVRQLVEHARRIGHGDLSTRLAVRQRDEIGQLGDEMNAMSERLERGRDQLDAETRAKLTAVEQLRHADRLATVGKLSAGIAHEVGTPLNVITGYAQLISDAHPPPHPDRDAATIIAQQAGRVTAIVRQLLDFARPQPPSKEPHDLRTLCRQAAELLETMARTHGVTIAVGRGPVPVVVSVDVGQLQQVIANLVVNALHASPPGTTIEIESVRRTVALPADRGGGSGEFGCLVVRDHGSGIAPDVVAHIFEPFFTTKDVGEGTGLGLSVAYGIVNEHGGWIAVESTPGTGTCFTVHLPADEVS